MAVTSFFKWSASDDPDGDAIHDYHFELSSRADMRYPLSLDFYKLISRTADVIKEKGKDGAVVAKAPIYVGPTRPSDA